jgi:hypothetical protein
MVIKYRAVADIDIIGGGLIVAFGAGWNKLTKTIATPSKPPRCVL